MIARKTEQQIHSLFWEFKFDQVVVFHHSASVIWWCAFFKQLNKDLSPITRVENFKASTSRGSNFRCSKLKSTAFFASETTFGAFLDFPSQAARQGKTILIAVYSHLPEIQRALWRMTGAALAGCVLGILCGFGKITWPKRCSASIAAAAFLGLCIENHALRIVLNTSCDLGHGGNF